MLLKSNIELSNIKHGVTILEILTILETHNMIFRIFYIMQKLCYASESMKRDIFMVFTIH